MNPTEVHWVQGTGSPNASTVGRNTLRTGGTNNFDLNLTEVDSVWRVAAFGTSLGSAERIQSPPVCAGAANERYRHTGGALPESRFHRQRHPQHVGAGETGILSRQLLDALQPRRCSIAGVVVSDAQLLKRSPDPVRLVLPNFVPCHCSHSRWLSQRHIPPIVSND